MMSLSSILIALPLLAGLSLFLIKNNAKTIALFAALANLALGFYALSGFKTGNQFETKLTWIAGSNINFHLGLDGISIIMVLLTAFLTPLIILSSSKLKIKNAGAFYALVLLAEAALIGVFMAKDAFVFYFFFEVALIPVYFLATIWGGADTPKAAFKMFVYTLFGSLLMLVALVFLYSKAGSAELASFHNLDLTANQQYFVFWCLIIAFGIKMPIFPLHGWQSDAYVESPTTATMILAGIMSKMGVYGLIRLILPTVPVAVADWGPYVAILAVIGLIYGSIIAIQQDNIKRLITYSSFAHVGLIAAGVLTGSIEGVQGAMLQMVAHGLNAVGLFFIVKIIYERTNTRSLRELGGITQVTPKLTVFFVIIMLGSVALPLTNGFPGEFLLLKSVFNHNTWLGAIAGLTIIFGAVYMLRMVQKTMFGASNPVTATFEDVSGSEVAVLLPIAFLVIAFGIAPNYILQIAEPAVKSLLQSIY